MNPKALTTLSLVVLVGCTSLFTGCQTKIQAAAERQRIIALRQDRTAANQWHETFPSLPVDTVIVPAIEPVIVTTPVVVVTPIVPIKPATVTYTLSRGDSMSGVAYRYGFRLADVLALNPSITNPAKVQIGQKVTLPACDLSTPVNPPRGLKPSTTTVKPASGKSVKYVVRSGDSLSVIAYRHGVKAAAIKSTNGLSSDAIRVGQILTITGTTKTPAPVKVVDNKTKAPTTTTKVNTPPTALTVDPVVNDPTLPPPVQDDEGEIADGILPPVASADATLPDPEKAYQTHIVKEGEDLISIAMDWGASVSQLKEVNNLTTTDVAIGSEVKIPTVVQ